MQFLLQFCLTTLQVGIFVRGLLFLFDCSSFSGSDVALFRPEVIRLAL